MRWIWNRAVELGDLCFPPVCLLCGQTRPREQSLSEQSRVTSLLPGILCEDCARTLEPDEQPACPRCAATVGPYLDKLPNCRHCQQERYQFDRVLRWGPYRSGLARIIRACKSGRRHALLEALADSWLDRHHAALDTESIGLVTAVPASHWSRWTRWSNHADVLAERLARNLNLPCDTTILRKVAWVRKQGTLPTSARRANVRHAFHADKRVQLSGATILLVDDVVTTGATADACARQLKSLGASRVIVATIARGLGRRGILPPSVTIG